MKNLGFGLMRLPLLEASDQTSIDMAQLCQMVDTFLYCLYVPQLSK